MGRVLDVVLWRRIGSQEISAHRERRCKGNKIFHWNIVMWFSAGICGRKPANRQGYIDTPARRRNRAGVRKALVNDPGPGYP